MRQLKQKSNLKEIQKEGFYADLERKAKNLTEGLLRLAQKHNIPLVASYRGSMWGFFFNDKPVKNYNDAARSDATRFAKFHTAMLEKGVYLACSQYETGFINAAMSDADIDFALSAAAEVFSELQ